QCPDPPVKGNDDAAWLQQPRGPGATRARGGAHAEHFGDLVGDRREVFFAEAGDFVFAMLREIARALGAELMAPNVGHQNDATLPIDEVTWRQRYLLVQAVVGNGRYRLPAAVVSLLVDHAGALDVARPVDEPLRSRKDEEEVAIESVDEKG